MFQIERNSYPGINPHLHSYLQEVSAWGGFHVAHLGDLASALKHVLLPLGFTATIQSSLQIRRIDESLSRPQSDLTIYDLFPSEESRQGASAVVVPSGVTIDVLLADENPLAEKEYHAIGVYDWLPGKADLGTPVAWIELLSPTNKGDTGDARLYRRKRRDMLDLGIVFIELDYLHESPPSVTHVMNYSDPQQREDEDAYPYRVLLFDPHPDSLKGPATVAEFDVEMAVPTIEIPLSRGVSITFDFGLPYQETYLRQVYGLELVHYDRLPVGFSRYSRRDQARIGARMLTVCRALKAGRESEAYVSLDKAEVAGLSQAEDIGAAVEERLGILVR